MDQIPIGGRHDRLTVCLAFIRNAGSLVRSQCRANLIRMIVGHPKNTPSKKELEYYNSGVAALTLINHLSQLEGVNRDR